MRFSCPAYQKLKEVDFKIIPDYEFIGFDCETATDDLGTYLTWFSPIIMPKHIKNRDALSIQLSEQIR